jgi:L-histidine N-alpha-methyltransferase
MNDFKEKYKTQLAADVDQGLSAPFKHLQSKYFYDATGDALFRAIMELPEYYLTRSEFEILSFESQNILAPWQGKAVNIIELGAGDGTKTKLFLEAAKKLQLDFKYFPVDISADVLEVNRENLRDVCTTSPVQGDYSLVLKEPELQQLANKLVLFLGSNIGNFTPADTAAFFSYLGENTTEDDHILIGFDLDKDPQTILHAYNDDAGVTRDFNLNLLTVLNRELGAQFGRADFYHYPVYDPEMKAAKSYLVSKKDQDIYVEALEKSFHFRKGEAIFTEISKKYTIPEIESMAAAANFQVETIHYDSRKYYVNVLMKKGK